MMAFAENILLLCWRKALSSLVFVLLYIAASYAIPVTLPSSVTTSAANAFTTTRATTSATTPAVAISLTTPPSSPTYAIESFSYNKVNNGEPTNLVCVVTGTPPPAAGNVSVVNTAGGGGGIVFQGTDVTGSTRTVSYQVNVRLDEVPQNFSCLLHRPDGSSVSKELSVSVYEPPWFISSEANILVRETSSDSITISWRPWNETHDNGDGPVIGYRVYYNIHGENTHQRASIDIITDTVFTITNLTRDTEYDFRVTAVREGLGGEGRHSSISRFSTRCSAPSEAPVLTVRNTGQTFISLSWKLIPEDSWGCRTLSGIQITLSTDEQIEIQRNFSATRTYATITELEVCTRYSIRAAFSNKDEFGLRSAALSESTSIIPPTRPVYSILQASPSLTQIEVNWRSSPLVCPPDYYIIRYSLYQRRACPLPETNSTEFEVNTTSSQHNNLTDLEPYSRYHISIVAVNGAGRSEHFNTYTNTLSGTPSTINDVMVDQERTSRTSIGFTWQPLTCKNVNAPFSYYYTRIYRDGDKSVDPVQRKYFTNWTISSVRFNRLEPCTMYELNINAVSGFVDGNVSRAIGVTGVSFTGVSALAVGDQPSLTVNWSVPSQCNVDYYRLTYQLISRKACPDAHVTDAPLYERNVTSVSTTISERLLNLEYFSTYAIAIIAVIRGAESVPKNVNGDTAEGEPSPLQAVSYTSTDVSLHFMWEDPSCENRHGIISRYDYDLYNIDEGRTIQSVLNTLRNEVQIYNLDACTQYRFRVRVVTESTRRSDWYIKTAFTNISVTDVSALAFGDQPSLTVYWSVPSQCNVDYYKLSYQLISRKACPDIPVIDAPLYELNVTSMLTAVSKRLSNLEYYSTYAISIMAVIRGAETLPTNVSGDTGEGEPSPLQAVSYTSTDVSLHFMWEDPSCGNRHDVIRGYEYDLYNTDEGRTIRSVLNTLGNEVQIYNLDACTRYRFRVRVLTESNRRSDWYIETAFTNISAPGMPRITQLTQLQGEVGATSLTMSWQPPTSPRCQPTHYEIQYYLRQGDLCEDIPTDPQLILAGVVDGTNFTFQIDKLRPNSEYMVFVRGKTTSGYGDWDSRAGTTGYSYPTGPPVHIRPSRTKNRSIVFTWEKPQCGYRNGPITRYEVMLHNSTGLIKYHGNVSAAAMSTLEIFDLIPYSNYSIRVRAWNYELAGVYSQEVWAQTDEAKPGRPIGVILPSSDLESIMVEWMSPNPPLGKIMGYYILYWETDAADTTRRNISIPCRDGRCSDVNYTFSQIIPDLQSATNYSIQVQAETSLGTGAPSPSEPAVAITSEGIPSDPQDVAICSRSNSSFMITWMPPKYPRGGIISYTLAYRVKGKPYDSSFRPRDSFNMENIAGSDTSFLLESLEPATLYEVYVTASTSKGEGESSAHVEKYTTPTPGCFDVCSKICRCSEGVSDCDTVTGACSSGRCMNGWSGSSCQIASPRLSESPSSVYTSCDTIAIIWKVWNGDHDSGEGPVGGYDIYLKTKTSAWAKFDFVIPDIPSSDIIRYVLNDLEPDVEYTISVSPIHIDDTGKSREYDGRGEEVIIRTVKCEPKSIPWAWIVSGILFFFLITCGSLFIGKWVQRRRESMNEQLHRESKPLSPVRKCSASSAGDNLYENPTFSGLNEDDHTCTVLSEDIKCSDQTNIRSEEDHEYEKCANPPSTVI